MYVFCFRLSKRKNGLTCGLSIELSLLRSQQAVGIALKAARRAVCSQSPSASLQSMSAKVAIILGSGAHPGSKIAALFAAKGYKVIVANRSGKNTDGYTHLPVDLAQRGGVAVQGPVRRPGQLPGTSRPDLSSVGELSNGLVVLLPIRT